jgi:ATP-dependent Clp protease adaptor protein ClpS
MTERKKDLERIDSFDIAVDEAQPKVKPPSLYRVVLLNDDFTPMEFVVEILESIFGMERTRATQVMLEVHTKGKGICGVFSYEIAETKLCTMEES